MSIITSTYSLSSPSSGFGSSEVGERHEWNLARRRRILDANVDHHEMFWWFLWQRRAEYAGYLWTDGSQERIIEEHLRKVRIEREEQALHAREARIDTFGRSVSPAADRIAPKTPRDGNG